MGILNRIAKGVGYTLASPFKGAYEGAKFGAGADPFGLGGAIAGTIIGFGVGLVGAPFYGLYKAMETPEYKKHQAPPNNTWQTQQSSQPLGAGHTTPKLETKNLAGACAPHISGTTNSTCEISLLLKETDLRVTVSITQLHIRISKISNGNYNPQTAIIMIIMTVVATCVDQDNDRINACTLMP